MVEFCKKITESKWFHNFIIIVILGAGVVVGLETYPALMEQHGTILHLLDKIILYIFVLEIVLKMTAKLPRPWEFFFEGWNVFDFIIVAVCFLPIGGAYIAVLRLARILRVFRLVSALPKLQLLVGALLKSIPSMSYVGILLFLLFYIYAVLGTFIFGANDPVHFGSLQTSMLTLFKVITLEGWIDILNIQIFGSDAFGYGDYGNVARQPSAHPIAGPLYFITFILLGTMIMLNLFIGVIINGMEETNREEEIRELNRIRNEVHGLSIEDEVNIISEDINRINESIKLLKAKLTDVAKSAQKSLA
jgi:voltage-gated sodium channel